MVCSEHVLGGGKTLIVWCTGIAAGWIIFVISKSFWVFYDAWLVFLKQFGKLGS